MHRIMISLSCLISLALASCGRSAPSPTGPEEPPPPPAAEAGQASTNDISAPVDPLAELFGGARELLSQGSTNAALQVLEQGLDAPELIDHRPEIYKAVTSVMLTSGRIEDVKRRLAAAFKAEPALSSPCLGYVRSYYLRQEDRDSAQAWVEQLLGLGLDDRMTATLTG